MLGLGVRVSDELADPLQKPLQVGDHHLRIRVRVSVRVRVRVRG